MLRRAPHLWRRSALIEHISSTATSSQHFTRTCITYGYLHVSPCVTSSITLRHVDGNSIQFICRSEDSIVGAFDAATERFGVLHGAVLAAGIVNRSHRTPLSDIAAQEFDDTCAVNLRGSFLCLKHAARHDSQAFLLLMPLLENGVRYNVATPANLAAVCELATLLLCRKIRQCGHGSGSIVTIASVAGLRGSALLDPCYRCTSMSLLQTMCSEVSTPQGKG